MYTVECLSWVGCQKKEKKEKEGYIYTSLCLPGVCLCIRRMRRRRPMYNTYKPKSHTCSILMSCQLQRLDGSIKSFVLITFWVDDLSRVVLLKKLWVWGGMYAFIRLSIVHYWHYKKEKAPSPMYALVRISNFIDTKENSKTNYCDL